MNSEMNQSTQNVQREYLSHEVVPKEGRHINFLEYALTWAGVSLEPTVWVLGGTLICSGFVTGSIALILASLLYNLVIGLIGYIGYKTGGSAMGSMRFVLGVRGSRIASVISTFTSCGWGAISIYMAAISLSYILKEFFKMPAFGEAGSSLTILTGMVFTCGLSYLGIVFGGARILKKIESFMMIALIVFAGIITVAVAKSLSWQQIVNFRVPEEYKMNFTTAFSTMFTVGVAYAAMACDISRYVKKARAVFGGPMLGAMIAVYWFCAMGMLGCIAAYEKTGVFDMNNANPSTLCMALGLGAPLLAVVVLAVVSTLMINLYSAAAAAQSVMPNITYKKSIGLVTVLTFLLALIPTFSMSIFGAINALLNILGVVLIPLFVIIIVDFYFINRRQYDSAHIGEMNGKYWFTKGYNLYAFICWVICAVIYAVLYKMNVASNTIGPTMVSCIVTAILYSVTGTIGKKKKYYH